ncbi:MAG: S41 family peptidase [Opitutaceae bacterium]
MLSTDVWRHARELSDGVVYLRFDGFDRASRRWLSEQLKEHRDAPAVIVDLRENPGGTAFSLGITVGEFFPRSVGWGRFTSRSGRPHDNESWQWGSARYAGKVAVLVDGSTASCAEIFARVLQYHHRAVVIGRKTAGAVIGSLSYPLPGGGKLQLGVYDYRGPDGERLEGVGVKPDIVVPAVFDGIGGLRADRDLDLEAALRVLKAQIATAEHAPAGALGSF